MGYHKHNIVSLAHEKVEAEFYSRDRVLRNKLKMSKQQEQPSLYPNIPPSSPPLYDEAVQQGAPYPSAGEHWANPSAQPATTSVVFVQQPTVLVNHVALPHDSARVTCPTCREHVSTNVEHQASTKTHLWAICLFLIGCWPCCFVPYCMDSCQTANHHCPKCGNYIGSAFD